MADLLVTGGAGFIGANFVHYWHAAHPSSRIVVLDALTYAGNRANLAALDADPRFTFVHGDIGTEGLAADLLRRHALDTVVHFAAESHVDRSILGPDAFLQTNIMGTHELLKAARQVWLEEQRVPRDRARFHHVSTDEVYGSLSFDDPPFVETTPYAPNSPYSASKAASDHLVRAYHHTYGLPVTTTNCSNNYGPWHFPEKLIPLLIVNVLLGRAIPVYGDGRNVRDWLYVEDHARAIDAVLARGRVGEVYNVGGRAEAANIDIVRTVCALVDDRLRADAALAGRFPASPASAGAASTTLITYVADRPGHDRRYAIAPDKLTAETGWTPRETLSTGLARTVDWFLANEPWWRGVMDGSYRAWIDAQYGATGAAR
ncbi:MAG: dTDP-glucose 4,6-dehydratase [Gemmatimonadaceae bacterium]|nr:dTDP-glucose 4,6-dehydratase [Gemmatimonadaceae bacterium]